MNYTRIRRDAGIALFSEGVAVNDEIFCRHLKFCHLKSPPYLDSLIVGSSTLDLERFYKLLPMHSKRELILSCFFDLVYRLRGIRYSRQGGTEILDDVTAQEVLCALSWHLPVHPWSKIHIDKHYVRLFFTPSSSVVVKYGYGSNNIFCTKDITRLCCSHIKRICAHYRDYMAGDDIIGLARDVQRQRDEALGKKKNVIPDIDNMKKSLFTSYYFPVKQVSLLFMREMGQVYVSQTLIENVLRCEISHKIYMNKHNL